MLETFLAEKRIKLFADGADRGAMLELARRPEIDGLTTNPTLMRKAGVTDYRAFARDVLGAIQHKPISFEVVADELGEMGRQARDIAGWGANVYVKIPITNSRGEPALPLIHQLSHQGVKLNVTGVLTLEQVLGAAQALRGGEPSVISVFAGRIADTGRDPIPIMAAALAICRSVEPRIELLWASPRQLLNLIEAEQVGCDIITVLPDILAKLPLLGRDLAAVSLDTVCMFLRDAAAAGYQL
jgi:transaldolase